MQEYVRLDMMPFLISAKMYSNKHIPSDIKSGHIKDGNDGG